MVLGTLMASYAAATRVIYAVLGTTIVAWAIAAGATRAAATGVARVLSGTDIVVSRIRHLSRIFVLADANDGGITTLGEGGATGSSSSDELDTHIYHV